MSESLILEKLNIGKLRCLSRNVIKWIAMFAMICDHVAYRFCEPGASDHTIGRLIIGRIAFPMFVALFVDGFFRTKHPVKHLGILFLFSVLSEPFFDMLFGIKEQSVMWTWTLGWLMFLVFQKIETTIASDPDLKEQISGTVLFFLEIGIMLLFAVIATVLNFDYIFVGICSMGLGYLIWKDAGQYGVLFVGIIAALIDGLCFSTYGAFLSIPVLLLYDSERMCRYNKKLKYLFYVSYPLHLAVIVLFGFVLDL